MTCTHCNCAVHSLDPYGSPECALCGTEKDEQYTEVNDAIVIVRMVGEDIDDHRDRWFDTEKEVVIHWGLEDSYTDASRREVRRADHTWSLRGQDEITIFGMAIHGEVYNTMIAHADYVRVGEETYDITNDGDLTRNVEIADHTDAFVGLKEQRY